MLIIVSEGLSAKAAVEVAARMRVVPRAPLIAPCALFAPRGHPRNALVVGGKLNPATTCPCGPPSLNQHQFPQSGAIRAQQRGQGGFMAQFIYHMHGLSKAYPGHRKVLEDINLSFYPDAKIGVLGVNGAGKST